MMTKKISKRSRLSRRAKREELEFYLFISPWIIGFALFTGGPIIASFVISLTDWTILSPARWIWFSNYFKLFTDPLFYKVLFNTAYYAFGSVFVGVTASLIAALLLNQKLIGVGIFRTVYYLPTVVAGMPMVLLFLWLYNPNFGPFNYLLGQLGIEGPNWLWDIKWVMPAIIFMNLWRIGTNMVIFLAALYGVPESLREAAKMDGANFWHQFFYITIPLISPIVFLVIVMSTIYSFQVFLEFYVMTAGGPANATLTYVLYIYQNSFRWWRMGYGSALAWILLVILLSLTWIQFKLARHWVYYEAEVK